MLYAIYSHVIKLRH